MVYSEITKGADIVCSKHGYVAAVQYLEKESKTSLDNGEITAEEFTHLTGKYAAANISPDWED